MLTPKLTRQVIGWIEIDPVVPTATGVETLETSTSLVAVFERWAGQGVRSSASRERAEAAPVYPAGAIDSLPAASLPGNSSTAAGYFAHNPGKRKPRRSSRFPRRARADLAAISTDLEAQFAEFRRRMPAVS